MSGGLLFETREPWVDGEATLGHIAGKPVYRYALGRRWRPSGTRVNWIMLNPSTADAENDDATIRRCTRYARDWGYGGIVVTNLYAWRATDPSDLWRLSPAERVGPWNPCFLESEATRAGLVVCGWGAHGSRDGRSAVVLEQLEQLGVTPHALRCTKAGEPGHPLYLPLGLKPRPIEELRKCIGD